MVWVAALLLAIPSNGDSVVIKSRRLTVLGTLIEEKVGSDKSTWSIRLNPVIMLHGQQITSLEIKFRNISKLASLEDKLVQAKGKLSFTPNLESDRRPVFELSAIKERKKKRNILWF